MECSVEACPRPSVARGLCNAHYLRQKRGRPLDGVTLHSDWDEKFLAYTNQGDPEECWEWTGPLDGNGYGAIRVRGATWRAHRLSYILHHGDMPEGAFICHHCDNPPCVNPAHLYAGTPADNVRDRELRERRPTLRGERAGSSVLTEGQVRVIRRLASEGLTQATIADRYGIAKATVSHIVTRRNWRHVA